MKKVLVTGAYGMLGEDLCPVLENKGYDVVETDVDIMDITSPTSIEKMFSLEKPDIVIHCAAYTNVDKAEEDIKTARLINVNGTENVAKACSKYNATMVYISTDYVFGGQGNKPYKPNDKTAPLNNYGLTKWEGEEAVRKNLEKYFICRTSWLYGHYGRNFVETMISLADKPELKVVDDQVGCPTWTVDLSEAIVKIIETKPYGTYHTCGGGSTSWYGFAEEIFKQAGLNVNLKPCTTDEFPRPAKRPAYSIMDNGGLLRGWKQALKNYMAMRGEM